MAVERIPRRSTQKLLQDDYEVDENKDSPSIHNREWVRIGQKVFRIRRPEHDTWLCTMLEVLGVTFSFALLYGIFYHYEIMHYHVSKGYAHLGYSSAQHVVGQRLLAGKGVRQNDTEAMKWFKSASDQGHPEAGYHLAIGQMQGVHSFLKKGESERLLRHAAENGVDAAKHALELCARHGCD